MGRNLLAMNVMWKYVEQVSISLYVNVGTSVCLLMYTKGYVMIYIRIVIMITPMITSLLDN